jgi:hypothetical protein
VESVVLDEVLEEVPDEVVEPLVDPVVLVDAETVVDEPVVDVVDVDEDVEACPWCAAVWRWATAWWAMPRCAGATRPSRLSQERTTCRDRRVLPARDAARPESQRRRLLRDCITEAP